jgi:3-oxoacyl-[acyl-carrier-protein] synthase-1
VKARAPLGIAAMGLVTPLGGSAEEVARTLFEGTREGLVARDDLCADRTVRVGAVTTDLPTVGSRNDALIRAAIEQIREAVANAVECHGPARIGVVVGTSTSGMAEHERARTERKRTGAWPSDNHYGHWELGALADGVASTLGLQGPAYSIATACSASAKVFASGRRLIEAGVCDAVVVGGADTLCSMTVSGFSSLDAVSRGLCNPFSRNRDGINIGEGAAAFLMTRGEAPVQLLGCGECSDAHHISAPHPEGEGAYQAMLMALEDADLRQQDVVYVNLHGTGTPLNDAMEAKAVFRLLGDATPCSSTKSMTGHALGAAGAIEAAFTWLTLHPDHNPDGWLPPHLWDGQQDASIPRIALAASGTRFDRRGRPAILSNSFAFGGNNVVLAFGSGGAG